MSSRLSCWINGHDWQPPSDRTYSDIFDNLWRLQRCAQCNATQRLLHRAWFE